MSRKIVLIFAIVIGLLCVTSILLFAQGDYTVLKTNSNSPYNAILIGDYHTFDDTDSGYGFHATFNPGYEKNRIYFTPNYTFTEAYVSFEYTHWAAPGGGTIGSWDMCGYCNCPGVFSLDGTGGVWETVNFTCTACSAVLTQTCATWAGEGGNDYWVRDITIDVDTYQGAGPTPTPTPYTITYDCNLENYNFNEGSEGWGYGDWIIWNEEEGWVGLHGCTDELDSFITQTVSLTETGPSDYYELTISSRNFFPVPPGSEPLLRWKLNSQIPGNDPDWYQGQALVEATHYWQLNSFILRESNSPAITDTLTIWASNRECKIDNVCILFRSGPAIPTPICPISPTYTPNPTYTPLPTPSPATTATATAWAATATAWATQEPYPTQPAPDCPDYSSNEPGWDFIWLMGQLLSILGAFFEAIFKLIGTVLQPIFDLFSFLVWLIGATLELVASLIDLIASAVQFLFSFIGLFFDLLEIIGAFLVALWSLLTMSPTDPGVEIPTYFQWGVEVWDFLIEGTPLEYLEIIAMALASLLIIRWTVKQFSSWG